MKTTHTISLPAIVLALSILSAQAAFAGKPGGSDSGVIIITQDKADAGGVTPGDDPGFPVTITEPGSYRLESNLTIPDTSTVALYISANDVSIDLNGFTVAGPNVCTMGGSCNASLGTHGIVGANNTAIFGGTVRGMGGHGISMGGNARVERVHAVHNGFDGISVGAGSLVTDCIVEANYGNGVSASSGSLVLRNIISKNTTGAHFPFSGALGLNSFLDNVSGPVTGSPTILQLNACVGSGC